MGPEWAIGTFIAIAAIIIPITYSKRGEKRKSKENREHLLVLITSNRKLSIELQAKLEKLLESKYRRDSEIFAGTTFGQYISAMESYREENLSDKMYERVKTEPLSDATIQSMTQSQEVQSQSLRSMIVEADMKLL